MLPLEIHFIDKKHVIREFGEVMTQEKEKDIKESFITDSQQTFQVRWQDIIMCIPEI